MQPVPAIRAGPALRIRSFTDGIPKLSCAGRAEEQETGGRHDARERGQGREQDAEVKASGDGASDGGVVFDTEENDSVKQVHRGTS